MNVPTEIKLYDTIGGWGISASAFTAQIPKDAKDITVRINSPGGDVADGIAMYNYLKDHPARVTTIVDGYAASSASLVMLAGDVIKVHKSSIVMVHNPWTVAMGDADDMRHTADVLDEHGKAILGIYMDATGKDEADIIEMMEAETWMRGEAAIENGFATELMEENEPESRAAASAAWSSMLNAIQNGREMMKVRTRKEIEDSVRETQAQNEALTLELAGVKDQVAAVKAEVEATAIRHTQEIEAKDSEIAEAQESARIAGEKLEAAAENMNTATARIEELNTINSTLTGEVKALKERLANPAHDDANMPSAQTLAQAQADAEADAAEQAARDAAAAVADAEKPSYDNWAKIEDPGEKRAYYLKHKDEILATM